MKQEQKSNYLGSAITDDGKYITQKSEGVMEKQNVPFKK